MKWNVKSWIELACEPFHEKTWLLDANGCISGEPLYYGQLFNPIALRKAKIVYNFGLSECNRVKEEFAFEEQMWTILWENLV